MGEHQVPVLRAVHVELDPLRPASIALRMAKMVFEGASRAPPWCAQWNTTRSSQRFRAVACSLISVSPSPKRFSTSGARQHPKLENRPRHWSRVRAQFHDEGAMIAHGDLRYP